MSRKNSLKEKWDFYRSLSHFSTGISVSLHAHTACCGVKKETTQNTEIFYWRDKAGLALNGLTGLVTESFSSCFASVPPGVGVARPTAEQQLWNWLNAPQSLAACVSGAESCLGLDLCWCLEHIIHPLLSSRVLCGSRENDTAEAPGVAGRLLACTTFWWQKGAAKCNLEHKQEDMAWSLIICMNHDSDNDNEQESKQSPRRPFSHSRCCCVYEIHMDVSQACQFYLLGMTTKG